MTSDVVFVIGIVWLVVLLLVVVLAIARSRTTAERLVVLDLAVLVLVGLLGLVAAQDQRSYALDAALALALLSFVSTLAAARYLGDRRPFEQPADQAGEPE
jgi:multicomponent Na+:H+ antiporter subunit F